MRNWLIGLLGGYTEAEYTALQKRLQEETEALNASYKSYHDIAEKLAQTQKALEDATKDCPQEADGKDY